jgi:peptide/nickel transport system substrate-binding protein
MRGNAVGAGRRLHKLHFSRIPMKQQRAWFRRAVFLLAAVCCPFLAGVAAAQIKEIRVADSGGDWGYPNPFRHYPRGPGYVRMSMVFDTLIWRDASGQIPALALSWTYQPESLSWVFKLRDGVKWHDGKPFTAADVAFTVQYFQKHPYSSARLDSVAGCAVSGPQEVTCTLKEPHAPFLAVMEAVPILPEHIWKKIDDPKNYEGLDSFIGTGPYRFVNFDKVKGSYLFAAFPDYYIGHPKVERLIYIKADDPLFALMTGTADLVGIEPNMAAALQAKGMTVIEDKRGWNKKLMINHKREPFSNKKFRHAIAYAISRQELIDKGHQGFGTPGSCGLLSPDHEFYNPQTPDYAYSIDKAQQLLTELGYVKGADGFLSKDGKPLAVHLLASAMNGPDRDGEIIRNQLEKAGIKVDLQNLEKTAADSRIKAWDFELAISGHGGLLGDPILLNGFMGAETGSMNSARYEGSEELRRLLTAQVREMDKEKRKQLVWEVQKLYAEELPALPLYYPRSMSTYNPAKGIKWDYTPGGVGNGMPTAQNKLFLVR